MISLTIWQLIALFGAGVCAGMAGVVALICALAGREDGDRGGCFERFLIATAVTAGALLLATALR